MKIIPFVFNKKLNHVFKLDEGQYTVQFLDDNCHLSINHFIDAPVRTFPCTGTVETCYLCNEMKRLMNSGKVDAARPLAPRKEYFFNAKIDGIQAMVRLPLTCFKIIEEYIDNRPRDIVLTCRTAIVTRVGTGFNSRFELRMLERPARKRKSRAKIKTIAQ